MVWSSPRQGEGFDSRRLNWTFLISSSSHSKLISLSRNEPSKHEDLVQKLQKNFKIANKSLQNCLSELAQSEIDRVIRQNPKPKFITLHKKEATPEFNRAICKGLEGQGLFMFLTSEDPDRPREGQILIQGPEEHCNALGSQ